MKINNNGQTLIIFVILIPFLIMIMAFVVDISYMYSESSKLQNATKTIINDNYDKRLNDDIKKDIKELYKKNDIKTTNLKVDGNENYLKIKNNYKIESIFGKIIGIKTYNIKVSLKGYKENNKIKVIEE